MYTEIMGTPKCVIVVTQESLSRILPKGLMTDITTCVESVFLRFLFNVKAEGE
jgi:hypothetical protein